MALDPALLSFAFAMGLGTFFSPCAWALVPAYVSYYAGTPEAGEQRSLVAACGRGLRFGAAAATGVAAMFLFAGAFIYVLRVRLSLLPTPLLADVLSTASFVIGLGMIVLGALMVARRGPRVAVPARAPGRKTITGMAGFGALFALASVGCTLPLFLGMLAAALNQGVIGSLVTASVFGGTIAGLLIVVSLLLSIARERVVDRVGRIIPHVNTASGLTMVAAGIYLLVFYVELLPA